MATDYGKRLRQARKHAGLTQMQLVKKTGIPQSTISTAERKGKGSSETPVYARACGVDPYWLATGRESMETKQATVASENMPTLAATLEDLSVYHMNASAR